MASIEEDIRSTPDILRRTHERVAAARAALGVRLEGPLALLGCGSSYCAALAAAAVYERERGAPAQAIVASDYLPRAGWTHVAISRTGKTTELVEAMKRARGVGAPVLLLVGEEGSPAAQVADAVLPLEFAAEEGVIQTRFVSAAVAALSALIHGEEADATTLPKRMERSLTAFDPTPLLRFDHVVFLGRGQGYGLARAAAVNLQETALLVPEAHQTLDYRHGPIAAADARTLVWSLDAPGDVESEAVLDDVRRTGATVYVSGDDPLITMAQAQLTALRKAQASGLDPATPRHLARAVVLGR